MDPLHRICLTAAVPTSMQVSGVKLTSLSRSHFKETIDGLERHGVPGWPTRLLLPWALGAGRLGPELRWRGKGVEWGWVCARCEGSRRGICLRQEDRDRRHGNGGRNVVVVKSSKISLVCMHVCDLLNLDRPYGFWYHIGMPGVCACVCVFHPHGSLFGENGWDSRPGGAMVKWRSRWKRQIISYTPF